jgi:hypothetical protein
MVSTSPPSTRHRWQDAHHWRDNGHTHHPRSSPRRKRAGSAHFAVSQHRTRSGTPLASVWRICCLGRRRDSAATGLRLRGSTHRRRRHRDDSPRDGRHPPCWRGGGYGWDEGPISNKAMMTPLESTSSPSNCRTMIRGTRCASGSGSSPWRRSD